MTERQVINRKYENNLLNGKYKNIQTQTGDPQDMIIFLSNTKNIRVYFSNAYKQMVVSFNFGSKSFIINKQMWFIFRKHFLKIDSLLQNDQL